MSSQCSRSSPEVTSACESLYASKFLISAGFCFLYAIFSSSDLSCAASLSCGVVHDVPLFEAHAFFSPHVEPAFDVQPFGALSAASSCCRSAVRRLMSAAYCAAFSSHFAAMALASSCLSPV